MRWELNNYSATLTANKSNLFSVVPVGQQVWSVRNYLFVFLVRYSTCDGSTIFLSTTLYTYLWPL